MTDSEKRYINMVELSGNLGKDAKLIQGREKSFVAFSIGTSFRYLDEKTNEWKNTRTEWHDINVFSPKLLENAQNLKKGDGVTIRGKISYKQKETGNGQYSKEAVIIPHAIEVVALKNLADDANNQLSQEEMEGFEESAYAA